MPLLPLLLAALPQSAPALADAELVLDINTTPSSTGSLSSSPTDFRTFGSSVLFVASGQGVSRGLWRFPAGGEPVQLSSVSESDAEAPAVMGNGRALFAMQPQSQPRVLAVTDGTPEGTGVLDDPEAGGPLQVRSGPAAGSDRGWFGGVEPFSVVRVGSTDGTQAGTQWEFTVQVGAGEPQIAQFHPLGSGVVVSVYESSEPSLLYSAGPGSVPVDLGPAQDPLGVTDLIEESVEFDGALWFVAAGPNGEGREPWRSDGTPEGTGLFTDLNPGPTGSSPEWLDADEERLFFTTIESFAGSASSRLFMTDGTAEGTVGLTDVAELGDIRGGSLMDDGRFLFTANAPVEGTLCLSDGTPGGTAAFTSIGETILGGTLALGPLVYFTTDAPNDNRELWVTDGTPGGTQSLALADELAFGEPVFGGAAGELFFSGTDSLGKEVWSTQGTPATTGLAANLAPEAVTQSSLPEQWVRLGSGGVFAVRVNGVTGPQAERELWLTDGTGAGTVPVPGTANARPELVGELGGRVLYALDAPNGLWDLWATDGVGSEYLVSFLPQSQIDPAGGFFLVQGRFYFSSREQEGSTSVTRLWVTDGTAVGTQLVDPELDIQADSFFTSSQIKAAALGSKLVFSNFQPEPVSSIWITDGTPEGTGPVPGVDSASSGSIPSELAALGGFVYYSASQPDTGFELYRTDGTAEGTGLFADLQPGPAGTSPRDLTVAGERLVFIVDGPESADFVAVTDGTVEGSGILAEQVPELLGTSPLALLPAGDRVAIVDEFEDSGFWITDGEPDGTHYVTAPEAQLFEPDFESPLFPGGAGQGLFFSARDEAGGSELWWWPGPGADAERVIDLVGGIGGSGAAVIGEVAGGLLVSGWSLELGVELFRIELADLGLFGAVAIGSPCGAASDARIGVAGEATPGSTIELSVTGAPPVQPALAYYDAGVSLLPLGAGCVAYLAAPKLLSATVTGPEGAASVAVTLPDDPALIGALAVAQWVLAEPSGPLGGSLALSDALELVLGS